MSSPRGRYHPDPSFWARRRVFLTGHTGFKGSWLTLWLSSLGAVVCGYALAPEGETSLFDSLRLPERCEHRLGDVRDFAQVKHAIAAFQPEIVIHMAAQPLVRRSYREPLETFATNVHGTANVLDACRDQPSIVAIISVTTDKCYLNHEWEWSYRETDALGGEDPYSASKACAEIVTAAWRSSFFSRRAPGRHGPFVASVRAGNVFGGGDWSEDRLIPDCVRAFSRGRPVVLRNPDAVRPWQCVLEPLLGYLMLARALVEEGGDFARAWNFGPGDHQLLTVGEIAELFAISWGDNAKAERRPDPGAPHEASLLLLDSGLAKRRLGWAPRGDTGLDLATTARWYRAALGGDELVNLSQQQIASFLHGSQT